MASYERLLIPRAWYLGPEPDDTLSDDSIGTVANYVLKEEFDKKQDMLLSSAVGSSTTVEGCLSSHETRLNTHGTLISQKQNSDLSQVVNVFGIDTNTVEDCLQKLAELDMQEITDAQVDAMWV